jgi:hydrogenase nickel incorporation protein HypB
MCNDCGCGMTQGHAHEHGGNGSHWQAHGPRILEVGQAILQKNQRLADQNRGFFKGRNLLVLNVVSAPGSGKTTLVEKTATALRDRLRVGVIVGDLATDNDAARLRAAKIPVVQINTGALCHLDAGMVANALEKLSLRELDVVIIENVGNLVCPAEFDLGEALRVVLLSVTEGEDKPLKYPPLFHSSHVALITKTDLSEAAGFDRAAARSNLERISHHAVLFELSARTGAGMKAWCDYLAKKHAEIANAGSGIANTV